MEKIKIDCFESSIGQMPVKKILLRCVDFPLIEIHKRTDKMVIWINSGGTKIPLPVDAIPLLKDICENFDNTFII